MMKLSVLLAIGGTLAIAGPPHIIMRMSFALYLVVASSCRNTRSFSTDLVDDWGWNNIGFRGNPEIVTPNMDALATEGVKMDRFYTHVSVLVEQSRNRERHFNHCFHVC